MKIKEVQAEDKGVEFLWFQKEMQKEKNERFFRGNLVGQMKVFLSERILPAQVPVLICGSGPEASRSGAGCKWPNPPRSSKQPARGAVGTEGDDSAVKVLLRGSGICSGRKEGPWHAHTHTHTDTPSSHHFEVRLKEMMRKTRRFLFL